MNGLVEQYVSKAQPERTAVVGFGGATVLDKPQVAGVAGRSVMVVDLPGVVLPDAAVLWVAPGAEPTPSPSVVVADEPGVVFPNVAVLWVAPTALPAPRTFSRPIIPEPPAPRHYLEMRLYVVHRSGQAHDLGGLLPSEAPCDQGGCRPVGRVEP